MDILRRTSVDRLNDGCNDFVQQTKKMFGVDVDIRCTINLIWVDLWLAKIFIYKQV